MKERYKPLWYALAKLLKDEMKDESAKMGGELEESVAEILQKVDHYKQKYSIPAAGNASSGNIV